MAMDTTSDAINDTRPPSMLFPLPRSPACRVKSPPSAPDPATIDTEPPLPPKPEDSPPETVTTPPLPDDAPPAVTEISPPSLPP